MDEWRAAVRCSCFGVAAGPPAIKVLFFDGTGLCLFYKRLDRGTFRWPESLLPGDTSIAVEEHALEALLDGIDVDAPATRPRPSRAH